MKKVIPLILLAVVVLISGCTEKQMSPQDIKWETFDFPGVFSIEYPSGWTQIPEGFVVTQPQKRFKSEDFEIGVTVIEALEGETLESVYQGIISEQEILGRVVTYQADTTWLGVPAKTVEITISESKRRQVTLVLKDDKFVLFDYLAPEIRFLVALPLADYMKESFKLKSSTGQALLTTTYKDGLTATYLPGSECSSNANCGDQEICIPVSDKSVCAVSRYLSIDDFVQFFNDNGFNIPKEAFSINPEYRYDDNTAVTVYDQNYPNGNPNVDYIVIDSSKIPSFNFTIKLSELDQNLDYEPQIKEKINSENICSGDSSFLWFEWVGEIYVLDVFCA